MGFGVVDVELDVGGLDRQCPALRHGVAGIEDKVDQRQLQLGLVDEQEPVGRRPGAIDLHRTAKRRLDQRRDRTAQRKRVNAGRRQVLLSRKRHHPPNQFRALLGRMLHLVQDQLVPIAHRKSALEQVDSADHRGEQIVEIMGNAAGQLAKRIHLLDLQQLPFQLLAVADVGK